MYHEVCFNVSKFLNISNIIKKRNYLINNYINYNYFKNDSINKIERRSSFSKTCPNIDIPSQVNAKECLL